MIVLIGLCLQALKRSWPVCPLIKIALSSVNGSRASVLVHTSAPGDGNDIVKRWKSIVDHICDDHGTCYHEDLTLEERKRKWLIPSS